MRIAVLGAGAMGQLFGAHLAAAAHDVVLIDVAAAAVAAVNERGIRVVSEEREFHAAPLAALAAEVTGKVELVCVFTKTMHTTDALASVAHLIGEDTVVLSLQNGLGNEEPLVAVAGEQLALIGMTDYPADRLSDGVATASSGHIVLGGLSEAGDAHAARVAAVLADAGMRASSSADVFVPIWEKAIFNAVYNTISAATGLTVAAIGREDAAQRLVAAVLAESLAAATAAGIGVDPARIRAQLQHAAEHHGEHQTSMLADLVAGRQTEVEAIGGAIVRTGVDRGVALPVLAALCDVVRLRSRA